MTTIGFLADLHIGGKNAARNLALVVDDLNRTAGLEAVFVIGDLTVGLTSESVGWTGTGPAPEVNGIKFIDTETTHEEEYAQCLAVLATLKVPWYCVPGNHDYFTRNAIRGEFSKSTYMSRTMRYDITNRNVRVGPFNIIGLDSGAPSALITDMEGSGLTEGDLEAVRAGIEPDAWNVVMMHHPVDSTVCDVYISRGKLPTVKNLKAEFRALMQELGVTYVLSGHTHRWEERYMPGTAVPNIQVPSTLNGEYTLLTDITGQPVVFSRAVGLPPDPDDDEARERTWQKAATRFTIAAAVATVLGFAVNFWRGRR